jgi:hypothetical protein
MTLGARQQLYLPSLLSHFWFPKCEVRLSASPGNMVQIKIPRVTLNSGIRDSVISPSILVLPSPPDNLFWGFPSVPFPPSHPVFTSFPEWNQSILNHSINFQLKTGRHQVVLFRTFHHGSKRLFTQNGSINNGSSVKKKGKGQSGGPARKGPFLVILRSLCLPCSRH